MSDISSVTSATPAGFFAVSPVRSLLSSPLAGLGTTLSSGLGGFDNSSTIIELSAVGQALSAAATFQSKLSVLQPGSTQSGLGQNFGTDFASLAAEAQSFVDAFNTVQGSLSGLQGPFGTATSGSLTRAFAATLNQQVTAELGSDNLVRGSTQDSTLSRLAEIGIDFQPASGGDFGAGSRLGIDLESLRQAFATDPEGSFSLLSSAVDSFEGLTQGFIAQTSGVSAGLASLSQLLAQSQAQSQSLSLFSNLLLGGGLGGGLGGLGNGTQSISNLLLLDALSSGGTGINQRVASLTQFMLVQSLLG